MKSFFFFLLLLFKVCIDIEILHIFLDHSLLKPGCIIIKFSTVVPTFDFEEGLEKYLLFVISLT